jgi:hypothetical protein
MKIRRGSVFWSLFLVVLTVCVPFSSCFGIPEGSYRQAPSNNAESLSDLSFTRRQIFKTAAVATSSFGFLASSSVAAPSALAFDGTGSSAYSGRSPATKAELKRQYKDRVVADVKDFIILGKAIDNGELEGRAWINFFITAQRREPDEVGRTYAALVDLRGLPTKKANEFEGGDGLLLANTFTKAGKPPDNTPAVRSFLKLIKTFDAIEKSGGRSGDAVKAKNAYLKTKELLEAYLADVELPGSLQDPLYQP